MPEQIESDAARRVAGKADSNIGDFLKIQKHQGRTEPRQQHVFRILKDRVIHSIYRGVPRVFARHRVVATARDSRIIGRGWKLLYLAAKEPQRRRFVYLYTSGGSLTSKPAEVPGF